MADRRTDARRQKVKVFNRLAWNNEQWSGQPQKIWIFGQLILTIFRKSPLFIHNHLKYEIWPIFKLYYFLPFENRYSTKANAFSVKEGLKMPLGQLNVTTVIIWNRFLIFSGSLTDSECICFLKIDISPINYFVTSLLGFLISYHKIIWRCTQPM